MRTICLLLLAALCAPELLAQANFSPNAQRVMLRWNAARQRLAKSPAALDSLRANLGLVERDGRAYCAGLAKVSEAWDDGFLERLGGRAQTRTGDVLTLQIPAERLPELAAAPGLVWFEAGRRPGKRMDEARRATYADAVHDGLELPDAYKGAGVIVGAVDAGFDPTHPAFWDENGSQLRIEKMWYKLREGTPPAGYDIGAEYAGEEAILGAGSDFVGDSHAAHVLGAAAGAGYLAPSDAYTGMAPEASILFADYGVENETDILDGLNWIFRHADETGRPAVANLSLGSHVGPHDGNSLLDQGIENLVGPGKIVVGAAGNEGDIDLHFSHVFGRADTALTIASFDRNLDEFSYTGKGLIDVWGRSPGELQIAFYAIDRSNGSVGFQTGFYRAGDAPVVERREQISGGQHITYSLTSTAESGLNGKPNILIDVHNSTAYHLGIAVVAAPGDTAHMWNDGQFFGADFWGDKPAAPPLDRWLKPGDSDYSVGEIGGTSRGVIAAGAWVSKPEYRDVYGDRIWSDFDEGQRAPYSSRGPTVDGRRKPDVSAPGFFILAAGSSSDRNLDAYYRDGWVADETTNSGQPWPYLAFEGTSMSAAVTTGGVALMLQANPQLTPAQVRDILNASAYQDGFTGDLPQNGDNVWGGGKLDVWNAVKLALETEVGVGEWTGAVEFSLYPNPATGFATLRSALAVEGRLALIDAAGKTVLQRAIAPGMRETRLSVQHLPAGVYACRVLAEDGAQSVGRLIVQ